MDNPVGKFTRGTIVFLTLGALIVVWSGVWLAYTLNNGDADDRSGLVVYLCIGSLLTGIVFIGVGFAMLSLGQRAAEHDLELQERAMEAKEPTHDQADEEIVSDTDPEFSANRFPR